jgi:uncharacterized protein YcaQ
VAALPAQAPELSLSADDVRLVTLRAQGFIGTEGRRGGVPAMLRRLGAVQLDTISVLARSHELVAYARLGPVPRERIERAYWHPRRPAAFEYWSHAACVLPIGEWPYYAFRRRALRARGKRWHQSHQGTCAEVLARLRAEGPLTATQLGGVVKGDGEVGGSSWWDWSDTKIAVEWLLDVGDVICVRREGWRRVYDLPDRVLPAGLLAHGPTDAECLAHLAASAARSLGVVTRADLIDYHRLRELTSPDIRHADLVDEAAEAAGLTPVAVAPAAAAGRGTPTPTRSGITMAWADPAALAQAGGGAGGRHRATLLSPFDSLVWDRKRTRRMFGFDHSLEAYVPRAKRVHGYYAMPLLAGGRLAGRVDPVRQGQTLVARQLSLTSAAATAPMARALREAAEWVGCSAVAVERVDPPHLAQRLRSALA